MASNRTSAHRKAQRAGRKRDGGRCQICGSKNHVEGHHIIAYQFGGPANLDNIITLCHKHHNEVHRGNIDVFKI